MVAVDAHSTTKVVVEATINGEPVQFLAEPRQTLLECLRDVLSMTGTKEGCSDGNCGACNVVMDGRLVNSCLVLGVEANGQSITTIEGIAPVGGLHPSRRLSLKRLHCSVAFARRGSSCQRRNCSSTMRTLPRMRFGSGFRAICADAPATTRSFGP